MRQPAKMYKNLQQILITLRMCVVTVEENDVGLEAVD